MLKPGGKMLITVPIGYNPTVDKMLKNGNPAFTKRFFLKRNSYANYWTESDENEALKLTYALKYNAANAIAILIYENK